MEEKYKEFEQHFKSFEQKSSLMFDANYDIDKLLKEKLEIDKKLLHLFNAPKNDANDKKIAALFKRIDEISNIIYSAEFLWGFTLKDWSNMDLSNVPIEKLLRIPFSTATKWPPKSKLPKGFDPEKLIEQAKTFKGLGVEKLHEQGITGKGVKVAYIDKKLDLSHEEFRDRNIEFVCVQQKPDLDFHGYSVLARLMGKNIGIAPDVDCIYYACDGNDDVGGQIDYIYSSLKNEFAALEDVIKRLKAGEQIVAVGVSASILTHIYWAANGDKEKQAKLTKKYNQLVKQLEKYGSVIFCSDDCWNRRFSYVFKVDPTKPNEDLDNYFEGLLDPDATYSVIDANKLTPLVYITNGYKYENDFGCGSWSIPQVLGLYCLAKQVDANLTMNEFAEIAQKTANQPNKYGARLINSVELIKEVKYRLENKCEV